MVKKVKRNKSYHVSYWPVVLWREDLDEIVEGLGGNVKITSGDYEFESLDDAAGHFGVRPQSRLTIWASSPTTDVNFTSTSSQLFIYASDESAARFETLNSILRRCERRLGFMYGIGGPMLTAALLLFGPVVVDGMPPAMRETASFLGFPIAIWMLIAVWMQTKRHSVIHFQRRSQSLPFMSRNRDAIALALISAAIGAAITLGVGQLKDVLARPERPTNSQQQR